MRGLLVTRQRRPKRRHDIKRRVTAWIRERGLQAGDKLPPQTELARAFGTTPVTIHKALTEMCNEGAIHRRPGVGTFVGPAPAPAPVPRRVGLKEMCLVLPEAHLTEPRYNPEHWFYVQCLMRSCLAAAGDQWTLSTRTIPQDAAPGPLAEQFAHYDAVCFHYDRPPRELIRHLTEHGIAPAIKLGLPSEDLPCLTIDCDRIASSKLGVGALLQRGYRRVAFIGSKGFWGQWSLDGYRQAHAEAGLSVGEHRILRVGERRRDGAEAAARLCDAGCDCDAVFVDADNRALGVLDGLRERGVAVPADVAVMGYDGVDHAVYQPPYLTSVQVPLQQMIAAALERAEQAEDRRLPHEHLGFMGHLIEGETVAGAGEAAETGRPVSSEAV